MLITFHSITCFKMLLQAVQEETVEALLCDP